MFYAVFTGYRDPAAPRDAARALTLFQFETELLYTILSTERAKLKSFTTVEHQEGIAEILTVIGFEQAFGAPAVAAFAAATAPKVAALAALLPDLPDPAFECHVLVPDVVALGEAAGDAVLRDALGRLPELTQQLQAKHARRIRPRP